MSPRLKSYEDAVDRLGRLIPRGERALHKGRLEAAERTVRSFLQRTRGLARHYNLQQPICRAGQEHVRLIIRAVHVAANAMEMTNFRAWRQQLEVILGEIHLSGIHQEG